MNRRLERIAAQLGEELGLLMPLLKHPAIGFVTFTEVRVAPDLRTARVGVSVLPTPGHDDPEETVRALCHSAPFLQHHLGKRLSLRVTPVLDFYLDRKSDIQHEMESLIRQARASDPDHAAPADEEPDAQ